MAKIADEVCRSDTIRASCEQAAIDSPVLYAFLDTHQACNLLVPRPRLSPLAPGTTRLYGWILQLGSSLSRIACIHIAFNAKTLFEEHHQEAGMQKGVKSAHLPRACAQQNGLHPCAQDAYASLAKKEGMNDSPPSMVLLGRRRNAYFTSLQPCTIREGLA